MPIGGRYRALILFIVAIVLAVAVTALVFQLVGNAGNKPKVQEKQAEEVVVAALPILPGWTIKSEFLAMRELPDTYVPDEVYRSQNDVIGRVAAERILGGEFIREERLADPDAGVGLPAIIPREMRALQVPVKNAASVSGFLQPKNYVDVIAVCTKAEPPEVRTLLQSVTVLAVNDRMNDARPEADDEGRRRRIASTVTLALSPQDAELVKHAFSTCRIRLTLRNDIDVTQIDSNEDEADYEDAEDFAPAEPGGAADAPPPGPREPVLPEGHGLLLPRVPQGFRQGSPTASPFAAHTHRG